MEIEQGGKRAIVNDNFVSYIIPAFNCESTITESLMSIIDGNLINGDEIIVTDDFSTDHTAAILDSFRRKYPFIKILNHRWNRGGAAARNTAVAHASNQLIFCLDSDNVLVEGSIAPLKKLLIEQNADVASFQELHYFKDCIANMTHKWVFKQGKITFADCLAGFVVPIVRRLLRPS